MPTNHVVAKGESLSSIARLHGFPSWRKIYDAPENSSFREKHPNPNLILPGDTLVIPDKSTKQVPVKIGQTHRFKLAKPEPLLPAIKISFVSESCQSVRLRLSYNCLPTEQARS